MPMNPEGLRLLLSSDEPRYPLIAEQLDSSDAPALAGLAASDDLMLASKAVYLASLLPNGEEVIRTAADSEEPVLRAASASALRNLPADRRDAVARALLGRGDVAIEKVAIRALGPQPGPEVVAKLEQLAADSDSEVIRQMSRDALAGG